MDGPSTLDPLGDDRRQQADSRRVAERDPARVDDEEPLVLDGSPQSGGEGRMLRAIDLPVDLEPADRRQRHHADLQDRGHQRFRVS
jgi:hypothetical protein